MIEQVNAEVAGWNKKILSNPHAKFRLVCDNIFYSRASAYAHRQVLYHKLSDFGYVMHKTAMIYVQKTGTVYEVFCYLDNIDGILMMRMIPEENEFLKRNIFNIEEKV